MRSLIDRASDDALDARIDVREIKVLSWYSACSESLREEGSQMISANDAKSRRIIRLVAQTLRAVGNANATSRYGAFMNVFFIDSRLISHANCRHSASSVPVWR